MTKNKNLRVKKEILKEYQGWELTINAFNRGIFLIKATKGEGLKILTPEQMLRRLPIALAQVKSDNTSEKLLIKIWRLFLLS